MGRVIGEKEMWSRNKKKRGGRGSRQEHCLDIGPKKEHCLDACRTNWKEMEPWKWKKKEGRKRDIYTHPHTTMHSHISFHHHIPLFYISLITHPRPYINGGSGTSTSNYIYLSFIRVVIRIKMLDFFRYKEENIIKLNKQLANQWFGWQVETHLTGNQC